MQLWFEFKSILVLLLFLHSVCCLRVKNDDVQVDMLDMSPGKRTFLVGKLLLIPTLAALGAKFLALLPIFLAKIALLGIMNFVSSNLNLIISLMVNFKKLFKDKSYNWPGQEDFIFPSEFEYSTLTPNFRYNYLFNRRSIKPEKAKVVGLVNDNFGNANQDKYKSYVNPYYESLTQNVQSADGNGDQLPYRRLNPSLTTGRYKCYWTDGSSTTESQLRKDFQPSYYQPRKDYNIKDFDVKDYQVAYNIKNFDVKDYKIKELNGSHEPITEVLNSETISPSVEVNKYSLVNNVQ